MSYKKLPPYSNNVLNDSIHHSTLYIYIGLNAWKRANQHLTIYPPFTNDCILLPPWDDPKKYKWPAKDKLCLIVDTSGADLDYVDDMACAIALVKPKLIVYSGINNELFFYQ